MVEAVANVANSQNRNKSVLTIQKHKLPKISKAILKTVSFFMSSFVGFPFLVRFKIIKFIHNAKLLGRSGA